MKFNVEYTVRKSTIRNKTISAINLDDAEEKLNKKRTKWVDITMVDKTKGIEAYKQ